MRHSESHLHGKKSFFSRVQDYLGEFVYGGIDGSVTTFAVVAGSAGADLAPAVVLILGFANLIADGFAMSVGAYLSTKSQLQNYDKHERIEYWEVDNLPEKERQEIREIYEAKGFEGELLEKVVDVITSDKDRWVDVMMKEELEMLKETKSPFAMGAVTFISFLLLGLVPLLAYVRDYLNGTTPDGNTFLVSCVLTSVAFMLVGLLKSVVTQSNKLKAIAETLFLGGAAAVLSYYVGDFLETLV